MSTNGLPLASAREVHNLFRSRGQHQDVPIEALRALRNQLSLKSGEVSLSMQDPRLILAQEWLELSPGAQDIFTLLEKRQQPMMEAICLSVLETLLTATTQYLVYQPLGHPIVKSLLAPRWLRKLATHLSGGHVELCISSLKLLTAISNFAGGKEQNALLESFTWDVRIFRNLLHMRKQYGPTSRDLPTKPDIRTLCLRFILSFLTSSSHTKALFLEQHRDILLSVFKGLSNDPYHVVHHVLETLWVKLWQDQKLRKTLKVSLFGEKTIEHLLKIYERSSREGSNSDIVPADVVHHFLLAICTHRGIGICFADNGWYPRQDNESEGTDREDRIHNKILAGVLKMLKVSDDARQQELAVRILQSCPELAAGYLQFLSPMLEPRLSSGWLANVAFYSSIVSLPVPVESFYLPCRTSSSKTKCDYRPVPPSLSVIVHNIFPSTLLKTHLTKALQSSHGIIQHAAGLLLARCLNKYELVQDALRSVKSALEEDDVGGKWARRLTEIDREIRRRVPELNVVIALSTAQQAVQQSSVKSAMLGELSHRLLWLYHRCIPSLVVEARYDVARSLRTTACIDDDNTRTGLEVLRLKRLQQLHILRILTESDQFNWHSKPAPSGPSNLYILLDLFMTTSHAPIRLAVSTLLVRALRDTLLFHHDPDELHIWLDALPATVRDGDVLMNDGVQLGDEKRCVISFLEMCMLRCSKTPHRYLEDLDSLTASSTDSGSSTAISPVLVTFLEQLRAKARSKAVDPGDALSLITFCRKVVQHLGGKQHDLAVLHKIASNLRAIVEDGMIAEFPNIGAALLRECDVLDKSLAWCSSTLQMAGLTLDLSLSQDLLDIITRADQFEHIEGKQAITLAYELVDRIRLLDSPPSSTIINRVASLLKRFHAPALLSFCLHLAPGSGALWVLADEDISSWSPTYWILFHLDPDSPYGGRYTSVLQMALERQSHTLYDYKNLVGFLDHRLHDPRRQRTVIHALEVLNVLMENAKHELSPQQFGSLKTFTLFEGQNMRRLSYAHMLPGLIIQTLKRLINTMFDASSESDCRLLSAIRSDWATVTRNILECGSWESPSGSCTWIKFMSADEVLTLTESLFQAIRRLDTKSDAVARAEFPLLIRALLSGLLQWDLDNGSIQRLNNHMISFLALHEFVPDSNDLDKVLLRSVDASLLLGCSGLQPDVGKAMLRKAVVDAEFFWLSRSLASPENATDTILRYDNDWSVDRSNTIASILYRSASSRRSFWSWLSSDLSSAKPSMRRLVPALIAVCDCTSAHELLEGDGQSILRTIFLTLVGEFCRATAENDQLVYRLAIMKLIRHFSIIRSEFVKGLVEGLGLLPSARLHLASLDLVRPLLDTCPESTLPAVDVIIHHSLQWAVRHLSRFQNSADLNELYLNKITTVVRLKGNIAAHYAEPVIGSAIRSHIDHAPSMHLAEALLERAVQKPMVINRHLQGLLQHNDFLRFAASDAARAGRDAIIAVLHALFFAYPEYTCQPTHIDLLVQVYSGSLATADRQLLAILFLLEERCGIPVTRVFTQWSQLRTTHRETALDSALDLDAGRVLRTCLSFPDKRSFSLQDELVETRPEDGLLYDPVFLLLLFSSTLAEFPPRNALTWISLYRTNLVSLVIRCLSSMDETTRRVSVLQLGTLHELMKAVNMQEKGHVIHLLDLIRDQLRNPTDQADDKSPYLPSLTTLFFAHALRGIFYPSNFIFPISARFLLQRPRMDGEDVPLLYSMLYSSTDDWKRERGWILRFLADGLLSGDDWRILKRRHTWDLLASIFQSSHGDEALRHSALEVLGNLTCHLRSTAFLVRRSSLINWIEIQLLVVKHDEKVAWAKILENISAIAGQNRSHHALEGGWQNGLVRCLTLLVFDSDVSLLRLITRVLRRLDVGRLSKRILSGLMDAGLKQLRVFEDSCDFVAAPNAENKSVRALPPHSSVGLDRPVFAADVETWGRAVENLWSVSLRHGVRGPTWDQLTSRLLAWRALIGAEETPLGEWARTQVLDYLSVMSP